MTLWDYFELACHAAMAIALTFWLWAALQVARMAFGLGD